MSRVHATVRVEDDTDSDVDDNYHQAATLPSRAKLPPITSAPRVHLPDEDDQGNTVAVPRGGEPQRSGNSIISVPEGGGARPADTGLGIISVPGDNPVHMRAAQEDANANRKPIDVVVYFQDKTGIHLSVEDGQHVLASELFEMVVEEMKFPDECREAFSLWLVSDYLELQLKPNHVPFKLACYWEELLEKYSSATEADRERDEPIIMFQRNVFYPRSKEEKMKNPELIRLLFHEAKENVVDGRYPLTPDQYDMLAGLHALLHHRAFDAAVHTPEYYRPRLTDYYPPHMCKINKWSLFTDKNASDYRITACHEQAFKRFGRLADVEAVTHIAVQYLQFCWKLPYYGGAFFRGQIEHPKKGYSIKGHEDDPVYIAVNTEGVFILDMDDVEFLLGLTFKQLSWEYAEPKNRDNPDCMPCLFLQFQGETDNGEKVTKMLQIFSREAVLMDALIEAQIKLKKKSKSTGKDYTDSADSHGVIQAEGETWAKFNRLCLAVFDRKGNLIEHNARVPSPN